MFSTKWERSKPFYEKGGGKVIVEKAGYVSANDRIQAIINAGQRLNEYRKEQFHFQADQEVPEDFNDPTVSPQFDEFAAKDAMFYVQDKVQEAFTKKSYEVKTSNNERKGGETNDIGNEEVDNQ